MVDPISTKTVSGRDLAVTRVAPLTPATTVATTAKSAARTIDTASLSGAAKSLSAAAPVDADRVAKVRKAIADGKFPILPITIADRLIAYKLEWMQNEQA